MPVTPAIASPARDAFCWRRGVGKAIRGMQIGYVGLGSMGGALAARLAASRPLIVFDKAEAARAAFAATGAGMAPDLADLAARCEMIFLCLPASDDVRAAIFGEGGLLGALRAGAIIVDQSTGDPHATRAMAAQLAERGVALVDAPVSGGRQGAQAGTIAIMVGAAPAEFALLEPVLRDISPNVFHAGGVGAGHVAKLVNNLMSTTQRLLSFEAVALAQRNGVDARTAVDILIASGGRNAYLDRVMGPRVLAGKLDIGFTLALAHKDVRLACELGQACGAPMFFGNLTRELYQMAIGELGREAQVDTVGLLFDKLANAHVVPIDNDIGARPLPRGAGGERAR